ncbi:MAG: type II toxin-antitoxin system VapC family toxin [Halodesulfurarchaeum sp.]
MAVAVIDTGVLIGRVDTDDEHHDVATDIVSGVDHGELPTGRVTNYVVVETLNWIHERKHHQLAIEMHNRLKQSAGVELVHAAQRDYHRAVELFETYETLAFGDATTVAYMERNDIEYLYGFDDDFDAVDTITRLVTAENPYQ